MRTTKTLPLWQIILKRVAGTQKWKGKLLRMLRRGNRKQRIKERRRNTRQNRNGQCRYKTLRRNSVLTVVRNWAPAASFALTVEKRFKSSTSSVKTVGRKRMRHNIDLTLLWFRVIDSLGGKVNDTKERKPKTVFHEWWEASSCIWHLANSVKG